jgi:MFS family permease
MSDSPFLLGVMMTLLGLAWFRHRRTAAIILLALGGLLAISMRPVFWALAIALAGAAALGLARGHKRIRYAVGFAILLLIIVGWFVLDPRIQGLNLLGGKYEAAVWSKIQHLNQRDWIEHLQRSFEDHISESLFGFELQSGQTWPKAIQIGFSAFVWSLFIAVIAWTGVFFRISAATALYVLATVFTMLLIGNKPRYFLMILPMVLVGWAMPVVWWSHRAAKSRLASHLILFAGLGFATIPNVIRGIGLAAEQHGLDARWNRRPFLEVYRRGVMARAVEIGQAIAEHVPPGQKVIGPEPRITSFVSGRPVYDLSEVLERAHKSNRDQILKRFNPSYAVIGKSKRMNGLIKSGILKALPTGHVHVAGVTLTPVKVQEVSGAGKARRDARITAAATRPAAKKRILERRRELLQSQKPATKPATRPPKTRSVSQQSRSGHRRLPGIALAGEPVGKRPGVDGLAIFLDVDEQVSVVELDRIHIQFEFDLGLGLVQEAARVAPHFFPHHRAEVFLARAG